MLFRSKGGASWNVTDNANWLSSVVTGSGSASRIALAFPPNATGVSRSATVSVALNPASGSTQALDTFVVKQYPLTSVTTVAPTTAVPITVAPTTTVRPTTTLVAATPTTVLVIAPLPPADSQWKCERFLSASPFRYTSRGCTTFAAGGLLTAATVSTNDVLVAQLRNNPRASWAVESDQSWASPSVSGSGETSRIKLSFANTDLQAARSAKIRLYLIPVEGTRQELGSFTVTQYPAEEIGRAHV